MPLSGHLVEAYIRSDSSKPDKQTLLEKVLPIIRAVWITTLSGCLGPTLEAALEDLHPAVTYKSFAQLVRQANEVLDVDFREHLVSFNRFLPLITLPPCRFSHTNPQPSAVWTQLYPILLPSCRTLTSKDFRHPITHCPLTRGSPFTDPSTVRFTTARSPT